MQGFGFSWIHSQAPTRRHVKMKTSASLTIKITPPSPTAAATALAFTVRQMGTHRQARALAHIAGVLSQLSANNNHAGRQRAAARRTPRWRLTDPDAAIRQPVPPTRTSRQGEGESVPDPSWLPTCPGLGQRRLVSSRLHHAGFARSASPCCRTSTLPVTAAATYSAIHWQRLLPRRLRGGVALWVPRSSVRYCLGSDRTFRRRPRCGCQFADARRIDTVTSSLAGCGASRSTMTTSPSLLGLGGQQRDEVVGSDPIEAR